MRYKYKKILSELWLNEYDGKNGLCLICNNVGVFFTRDGYKFCICPNGRVKKKLYDKK